MGVPHAKKMFLLNIMRIANVHFSLPISQSDPVMRGLCNSLTGVFELSAGIDYSSVTCGKTETTAGSLIGPSINGALWVCDFWSKCFIFHNIFKRIQNLYFS